MPPETSVEHVEDDVLVDKDNVALNLCIELVGYVDRACAVWGWFLPFSADFARVHDLMD